MPSQIRKFDELITMLGLQKTNLATYFTQCNATAGDVTEITTEFNNLTASAAFCESVESYSKVWFGIKQAIFDGDPAVLVQPPPPVLAPPVLLGILPGALFRARDRNRRFKAGPGYTDIIGDALGIGPG